MNKANHKRSLLYGVGINDADYTTQPIINGVKIRCPFYVVWANMMKRCYCKKFQQRRPTYYDCSVDHKWHSFMNFRSWMIKQDWEGKQLDKDILIPGNKVYSPDACMFVSGQINNLFVDSKSIRGAYPNGVTGIPGSEKVRARVRINGKSKYLGRFDSVQDAYMVASKAKAEHITNIAQTQLEPIKSALLNRARLVMDAI